jgi:cytochrome P450
MSLALQNIIRSHQITQQSALRFEPESVEFAQDPYATYELLRGQSKPFYFEAADIWLLSRYEAVDAAARHPKLVRSLQSFMPIDEVAAITRRANWHNMPNHSRFVQTSLLDSDGDVHFRLRLIVLRELSKNFVLKVKPTIQAYVDTLVEQILERQEIDFIADLAAHVPGHIIGNILGVPDEDCPQLRLWSEDVVQFFDVGRTQQHKQLAERATTEFYLYLKDLIADRKRHPKNDLVSTLLQAQIAGELSETELISTCMLILMAGHGSTIDVLGTGMYALIKHPQELQRLRQQPQHLATAVQEMFRYDSPLPFFHRYASEDVVLMGQEFPKGTKFGLLYGSANRDASQFTEPDRFDISRQPNRHIAFGRGAHLCLGNHLSRLDMEVIFSRLIERTRNIEVMGTEPKYKGGLSIRGLETLSLRFTAK